MNFLKPFVHETAILDHPFKIGNGTKVWHFTHICSQSEIGSDCMIGANSYIGPDVTIGNGCRIQNNAYIPKGVVIGNGVFIGPSVTFTNIKYPNAAVDQSHRFLTTIVQDGVVIGAGAVILPGITLGTDCSIGAGAVVTKDVEDYILVYGNPAKGKGLK
jgi:UDP-2-acetamido-3-amino-2,3-dideoxy-glucuronate N-acetyltransferase